MLAILDFGCGFKSAPLHLPEELHRERTFTYYLFKPATTVAKASDVAYAPDIPKELCFEWYGKYDYIAIGENETVKARVYNLADVKKL